MTLPTLVPVTSSNIAAVGYDPDTRTLYVAFGRPDDAAWSLYAYDNVPPHEHAGLMVSASKGKYLNSQIKGMYEYRKIEALEEAA